MGPPRRVPSAKDAQWPEQRAWLDASKPSGVAEGLLAGRGCKPTERASLGLLQPISPLVCHVFNIPGKNPGVINTKVTHCIIHVSTIIK